ncbi:MAG: hypothetical protein HKO66_02300 [Saprospiraceae bacterium]|nr:hypothetical protein [Bacteroidia bacterium]NNE13343.1 hypothetical protein [Saprospiraceae bacterium]NNL91044.1 hypothetical protein [Saprospiraceae bacterium]
MKRTNMIPLHLLLLLFVFFSQSLIGQKAPTFKVVGESLNKEVVEAGKRLDVSKINVENISDMPIFLKWKTVHNSFPKAWDCSMCQHGKCQIGIPEGSSFKKLNPDQQGYIAIHVMPGDKSGKGVVTFKIYDIENPDFHENITFEVEVQ